MRLRRRRLRRSDLDRGEPLLRARGNRGRNDRGRGLRLIHLLQHLLPLRLRRLMGVCGGNSTTRKVNNNLMHA